MSTSITPTLELRGLEVQAHDKEEKTSGIMADSLHLILDGNASPYYKFAT